MNIPPIHISLHFRDGGSEKECHAAIEPCGGGYIVTFAYGRLGKTLTIVINTDLPRLLETATKLLIRLVASRVAKRAGLAISRQSRRSM